MAASRSIRTRQLTSQGQAEQNESISRDCFRDEVPNEVDVRFVFTVVDVRDDTLIEEASQGYGRRDANNEEIAKAYG